MSAPDRVMPPHRFEWERRLGVNEWVNLVRGLRASHKWAPAAVGDGPARCSHCSRPERRHPVVSPFFRHDRCGPLCLDDKRGPRLGSATIKQVGLTLATFARPNGSDAHPGAVQLAVACARDRRTVVTALGHLETVGLIMVQERAGTPGRPRWHATNYYLATPPIELLAVLADGSEDRQLYDWFLRPPG